MSVRVNVTVSEEPYGGRPEVYLFDGNLWIWPGGIGLGSSICMDPEDWGRIRDAAEKVLAAGIDRHTA